MNTWQTLGEQKGNTKGTLGEQKGNRKGTEREQKGRSVDNCPAHRGKPPDGRPSVRQFPTSPRISSKVSLKDKSAKRKAPRPCPLGGCAPPAFDTGKRVSNLGLRDHDRTIGLALRFRLAAAPLHAPIEHRHPLPFFFLIQSALGRSRPVFSYLPEGLLVLRCAAARLGCLQSLPVQPDPHTCMATSLESNPCRYDKAPMARATGNRVLREFA